MQLIYYIFLLPLSRLPFWALYRVSDFFFVVLYYAIAYRKKVVSSNLKNSFPEYSAPRLKKVEREFYRHFCDLIVESIKAFTISEAELNKRFSHRNPEIFKKYFVAGQHITLVGGHSGNWELFALSIPMYIPHLPIAIYSPLNNPFMNSKILQSRSKFGLWMKSYNEIKKIMSEPLQKPVAVIFGADQCPNVKQTPIWTDFLNQETGIQFGAEKFAVTHQAPVIYGYIHKPRRGYYEAEYTLISEHPTNIAHGEITELHTRKLEADIRMKPSNWLWTHKRWKRTRKQFEEIQKKLEESVKV